MGVGVGAGVRTAVMGVGVGAGVRTAVMGLGVGAGVGSQRAGTTGTAGSLHGHETGTSPETAPLLPFDMAGARQVQLPFEPDVTEVKDPLLPFETP